MTRALLRPSSVELETSGWRCQTICKAGPAVLFESRGSDRDIGGTLSGDRGQGRRVQLLWPSRARLHERDSHVGVLAREISA